MESLPHCFGASYLINLPERTDRLKETAAEFARVGWNLGPNQIELFPARKFSERGSFPSAGVRGAFQSHWDCVRRAADANRSVLILEDDIALSGAVPRVTAALRHWLQSNAWDFVFFGHHMTGVIPEASPAVQSADLRFDPWNAGIQGLHFYAVHHRILSRLNAHLGRVAAGVEGDQEFGPMPVDGAFNIFRRKNPDARTFIVLPKLGWQRPSRSDITPRKFDAITVLRPIVGILRRFKHRAAGQRMLCARVARNDA